MAKYESEIKMVPQATAGQIYAVLSNPQTLQPLIDGAADNPLIRQKLEEAGQDPSQLEKLKDVILTADSITFPAPMVGQMSLDIIDREQDKCVKYNTQAPIEATLWIQMLPVSTGGAKIRLTLQAELNMMMKMMIGSKLEKGLNGFADMLAQLPYAMI